MSKKLGPMGWIAPELRNHSQQEAHEVALAFGMTNFSLPGYREEKGRFPLWKALQKVLKLGDSQYLPFNWQVTGSCVGAGGDNMRKVRMAIEIDNGELEEWQHVWWPFTYGRSRFRCGMRTPGEGSLGSSWAEAAVKDGCFSIKEKEGLPEFKEKSGWLQLSSSIERKWSDGDSRDALDCMELGVLHLFSNYSVIRNSDEAKAAISGAGSPLTLASQFGTKGPRKAGTPAVMLAGWDASWSHQMSCNECWDHPTLGLIFYIQNNWGPTAHPAPLQGEPYGGFYVTAKTFDKICKGEEVFAFAGLNGFKAKDVDWNSLL